MTLFNYVCSLLTPLPFVIISSSYAHNGIPVNNHKLGIPGFPDCILPEIEDSNRRGLFLDGDHADPFMRLECYQRGEDSKIKIGCIGDSITAGAHSSGASHTYPSILQKLLGEEDYAVTNLGACGSTMLKHGDSPYWERPQFETLTANAWDILIIMLGTNDAKDKGSNGPANWPHNCMGPDALSCSFAEDYVDMIELARTLGRSPDEPPEIYVMIPPPLMKDGAYGMNATVIDEVFPILVPSIAKWAGLFTDPIDIFSEFGGHQLSPPEKEQGCSNTTVNKDQCSWYCDMQSCDQCHPNDVGYFHMAKAVHESLGL